MSQPWSSNTFSVMQFNVLCQIYEPDHLPNGATQFKNRKDKIVEQVEKNYCDVVALQEANPSTFYREAFGDKYHMAFVSKTDFKHLTIPKTNTNGDDGRAPTAPKGLSHDEMLRNQNDNDDGHFLMVRKQSGVELIRFFHIPTFDTSGHLDKNSGGWAMDKNLKPNPSRLGRQNAIVALCHHRATGKHFLVASSHMKANGFDSTTKSTIHEDGRRICHIRQMLAAIHQIQKNCGEPSPPVIFMGDFNADLNGASTHFLLEGRGNVNGTVHHAANLGGCRFNWRSVTHEAIEKQKKEYAERAASSAAGISDGSGGASQLQDDDFFTILVSDYNPTESWQAMLDYILYEQGKLALVAHNSIPWRKRITSDSAVAATSPVAQFTDSSDGQWGLDAIPVVGSDHVPVAAQFLLL